MVGGSVEAVFNDRIAADPSRPVITFYDDATGERAELSAKSLGNWVAKTHFLLLDELGRVPGDRAYVALPVHWLAAPVLLGCWFAGLEIVTDPSIADVAFGDAESLSGVDLSGVDEVLAVSLLSMARPGEPPPGAVDYATAVRPQPDKWASVRAQAAAGDPAWDGRSRPELLAVATARADELGLSDGGRLLWTGAPDWISALLAPLAVRGSAVLVRNAKPDLIAAHATAEQATVVR
jgi:uncharacterized protein (TIGR03089 family)